VLYRVTKEKAATNQRKIVFPLENTLLLVIVVSKSSLLIGQFQIEYDKLPESFFEASPPCKNQKNK